MPHRKSLARAHDGPVLDFDQEQHGDAKRPVVLGAGLGVLDLASRHEDGEPRHQVLLCGFYAHAFDSCSLNKLSRSARITTML